MLRTIVLRNQALTKSFKQAAKSNVTRCLSTELVRRKQPNKLTSTQKLLTVPQWSVQMRHYADLPPHSKINLPALSPTMETGSIVRWEKKEGDKLNEGELLCEIETDKATMGFEVPEEGYLAKILLPEGSKGVPVGKLLCIIVQEQSEVAAFKDYKDDSPAPAPKAAAPAAAAPAPAPAAAPAPAPVPVAAPAPAPAAAPAAPADGRVYASPFARRIAELRQIRLGGAGSGLYGSLKAGDLSDAAPAPAGAAAGAPAPAPAPGAAFVDIPLSGMRETIAKRLSLSKQTVPHFQVSATLNIEKTLKFREALNKKIEKTGLKVSVNDFIIKAMASACKRYPQVNAYWMDTYIRQFSNVDVSVAVATPTGLITPIVNNADSRGILDISTQMKDLAQRAKEGKLKPQEYQGGTITLSNVGMFGVTTCNAIVNPPQSLILTAGGLEERVIADPKELSGFRTAKFVTIVASADHRVVDGATASQWIMVLKANLEDPANMIL